MSGSVVDMTDLTTDQYRDAVSNFPTGLVVVTAKVAGELLGFTCQTFGSLSLEPPRILFAAGNMGSTWPKIKTVTSVAISILADSQEQVARAMATSGKNKFEEVETIEGQNGAPKSRSCWLNAALSEISPKLWAISRNRGRLKV